MDAEISRLTDEQRQHVASWAVKTSRTEEWTGQQVLRLLGVPGAGSAAEVLQQAQEELHHARRYADFAHQFATPAACEALCVRSGDFVQSGFTAILRALEATPVQHGGEVSVHRQMTT